ncbi:MULTISPECIES: hypothetical protein [unclassified Streptomyces]|uniref:hypothetical protein n=1 Tax=unclassified Streptomyces TaxID=2593676 RepID=UPI002E102227|nr:hypothetical protein OG457_37415 [Streptomyces sp. NBC_01207]WTA22307.1 hypothetical protein OG365_32155 [Streptomyces sp. NBC_00853]
MAGPVPRAALALRAALVSVVAWGGLTACAADDEALQYATDYAGHEPLGVVGYPTSESLQITQKLIWRLADGKAEEVESLAADPDDAKGDVERTARNWIRAFHEGAKGKVTAEFYDEGSVRQLVVVYFHDTGQTKSFTVRLTGRAGEDGWRVSMREPDPKQASATPDWVPRTPGALGSKTSR